VKQLIGTVGLVILGALFLLVGANAQADAQGSFDQELIRLTNNHRASVGRTPLVSSPTLNSGSLAWSTTMRDTGNFVHASGLGNVAENIGYSHGPVGQRVRVSWSTAAGPLPSYCTSSMDYTSAEFMMCGWLSSSGHRRSIEAADYRQVGSGTATAPGSYGRQTYSTMRFSATAPVATTNTVNIVEPGHTVVTNVDGDIVTVALKDDGALWIRRNLGSGWSSWQNLGNGGWASTDVTIAPDGSAHVVAVKSSGQLHTIRWSASGSFGSWVNHGNGWSTNTTPSIAANSSRVVLGAITSSGELRTKTQQGAWSGATVHGARGWASVDVDIAADGDIWFAGIKHDGRLYLRKHLGAGWSGFAQMGAPTWSAKAPPSVAARSNGVIFAAVKQDGRLYTREQKNNTWARWVRQGISSWSSADIDMTENGHVWLAAVKNWGRLYTHERTPSGTWRAWGTQGASTWSTNASPSISVANSSAPVFVAVKANGILYQRAGSASGWSPWMRLGSGLWAPGQ
jgi:uncharacterized protein YkwD